MKILLFKKGALGDILMSTPLVRQIRRQFPDAQIDYLVGQNYQVVLANNPHLDQILTFDDIGVTRLRLSSIRHCLGLIRASHYDTILVLDRHWFFTLLAWMTRVPKRIGFWRDLPSRWFLTNFIKYRSVRHEILYYLDLMGSLAPADYRDVKLDFVVDKTACTHANQVISQLQLTPKQFFVAVNSGGDNPGESSQVRKLPLALFQQILIKLSAQFPVLLVGGNNDANYYQELAQAGKIYNLAGQLSLQESTAIMSRALRVYTTDSGPMHLAATTGADITAFFGPTNPARKAPLTKNSQVFWGDQDIYQESYELYGRVPHRQFFTRLNPDEVVVE